jgi:choice-of-anchor B domain-containing protein
VTVWLGFLLAFAILPAADTNAQSGPATCIDDHAAGFRCRNVNLLSWTDIASLGGEPGILLNTVWGWTDPMTGREYALAGRTDGTAIVDVTTPTAPVLIASIPTETFASVWRDIKVIDDHAVIVADAAGWHGMQIVDLTRLRNVTALPATLMPDTVYSEFGSAHNVAVNEESGFAYVVGISNPNFFEPAACGGGLHMVDMRDPRNPAFVGCFSDPRTGRPKPPVNERSGYSHDVQCVNYNGPDLRYRGREICIGSNETAISIADVTDKQNPMAVSFSTYPNVGYAHQGWLTDDHRYFYLDDELDESYFETIDRTRTVIFDLVDLEAPVVLTEYFGEVYAIDHNQYVVGNRVFQANYTSGLRVLDISDVGAPIEVGYFVTYLDGHAQKNDVRPVGQAYAHLCHEDCPGDLPQDPALSFAGAWNVYPFFESGMVLVSSIGEGLFVLDASEAVAVSALMHDEDDRAGISVYPRPAMGEVTLNWNGLDGRLILYDAAGRRLRDLGRLIGAGGSTRISVADLPPGLYFVRAEGGFTSASTALVVVR